MVQLPDFAVCLSLQCAVFTVLVRICFVIFNYNVFVCMYVYNDKLYSFLVFVGMLVGLLLKKYFGCCAGGVVNCRD